MAYLSAQDMVTRVRLSIGNADTALYPDAYILQSLNNHQRRIQLKYDWAQYGSAETVTTVAGTAEYALTATDVLVLENVVNTTLDYDLETMNETDYDLWQRSANTQGCPTHYMISDHSSATTVSDSFSLTFYPTPDAAYALSVRYSERLPEMVLSPAATYSVLPSQFDEVLIAYAIADAWLRLNEFQKASAWGAVASGAEIEAYSFTHKPSEVVTQTGRTFKAGIR